jgi:hypothetical protein
VIEARRRGAHLVAIDPIKTRTATKADEHPAPIPGTDAALALGLMNIVLGLGAEDPDYMRPREACFRVKQKRTQRERRLPRVVPCDCRRWIAKTLARTRERKRLPGYGDARGEP